MKRKIHPLLAALVFVSALAALAVPQACDMEFVYEGDSSGTSAAEIYAYEQHGRYLKITNLPSNTQAKNFSQVSAANAVTTLAKIDPSVSIKIVKNGNSTTAYVPLVYATGEEFIEDGPLFVILTINVDAYTSIAVSTKDRVAVNFSQGRGSLDMRTVNFSGVAYPFLTITNLPSHVQQKNISDLSILNQAGKIGVCADYDQIIIEDKGLTTSVTIPLAYDGTDIPFEETGIYFVSFDINVDALIRITPQKKVSATFYKGSAILDASLIGSGLPVPVLTIAGLPPNTQKRHFSDIFLYNLAGKAAKCADYTDIAVTRNASSATAMIPLAYNNSGEYFRDTGVFALSFTVNVDYNTQISKLLEFSYTVTFTEGFGFIDLDDDLGFFKGGLTNPDNNAAPVIKKGTAFEMNGFYYQINFDTPVSQTVFSKTSLAYIYAVKTPGGVEFEYSDETPVYDAARRGYYSGENRALFKFLFVRDTENQYFAKTLVGDPFDNIKYYTAAAGGLAVQGLPAFYSLPGTGSPPPDEITLPEGAYVFVLSGAGGGSGGNGGGGGGAGGIVYEVVVLSEDTDFTFFSGQGGSAGGGGSNLSGGGGGGGSGSFAFSLDAYFLCAGGGGGGRGGQDVAGPGGGGAGGAAGSGGGGGGAGGEVRTGNNPTNRSGGAGGRGGGYSGGGGGGSSSTGGGDGGGYGWSFFSPVPWGYQGAPGAGTNSTRGSGFTAYYLNGKDGAHGGPSAYTNYNPPENYKNTTGVNGQGNSGSGGNNRNTVRGGGAGAGGTGSVTVYRIF